MVSQKNQKNGSFMQLSTENYPTSSCFWCQLGAMEALVSNSLDNGGSGTVGMIFERRHEDE